MISIQNGISNAETLRRLLPKQRVFQGMVPYNVVHLGPGRWHRATWGDLTAEDDEVTRALAAAIGDRPGRLRLSPQMESVMLGQARLQPQQCDQRAVGRDHPRRTEAARLSAGVRRGDHGDARTARSRRDRAGPDRQDRPAPARPCDRRARFHLQQHVPQDPEDRPQGPRLDGRRFRRRAADRGRLSERRGGAARRAAGAQSAGQRGDRRPRQAARSSASGRAWTARALREHVLGKRRAAAGFGY